ncbi:MAG: DUF1127 domain-containing protein [Ectothiorhodospiraceae bacterium]|nr:DUF1127 domain-containing protein [Ectothiorhodospiraceae bacterium]
MRTPYAFYLLVTGATGRDQGSSAGAAGSGGGTLALSTAIYHLIDGIGRAVHRLVGGWRRWRAERAAARHLARLDDHLLRDIGLDRGQIGAAVAGSVGRRAPVLPHAAPMAAAEKARSEVERLAA